MDGLGIGPNPNEEINRMQVPLELSFRDIDDKGAIEPIIREKVDWLHRVCDYITSCRVAVEKPQRHQQSGNPYRVRINVHVPPNHEIVVAREPGEGNMHDSLETIVRDAFHAVRRQLKEIKEKQSGDVKSHPDQQVDAVIEELESAEGYGYLRTVGGRRIYFHRHALLNEDFDNLTTGTGVHFVEEEGEQGPQATTVHVVQKKPTS
jgi:cold shock CspA family protein